MKKSAHFSPCGKHRLRLYRIWNEALPKAMCIGLNPSTANAEDDDPTISYLCRALQKLNYGGVLMVNCFTLISSNPKALSNIDINDPANTDNQYNIGDLAEDCATVIFGWGSFKAIKETGIDQRWIKMFPNAMCFGKTKSGAPYHPLFYLMYKGQIKNPQLIKFN